MRPFPVLGPSLLLAASAALADPAPQPASTEPGALLQALPEADRADVLAGRRVASFAPMREQGRDGLRYEVVSLGVLPVEARVARSLLRRVQEYPAWVPLAPTYKAVRVRGAERITAEVGRSESPRAKRILDYRIGHSDGGTTWTLAAGEAALKSGSTVSWRFVALPGEPGRCLVVHRQVGLLQPKGRMTRYLDSDDSEGRNRYWKDANKHARRIHWAFEAALTHPAGPDREALYVDRHAAEFWGAVPWWAR